MDENRHENRNYRSQNHRQHSRFRGGSSHGGGNRPRQQRPLLTSSINGAGLALIALAVLGKTADPSVYQRLALAVVCFAASALISYIAQRVKPLIVELVSDLFFLVGAGIILYVGLQLGEFLTL